MARNQPEFRLQCLIADLLRYFAKPGLYWAAIPNGENRSAVTGARLKRMGVKPGAPDLLLIWDGVPYGVEVKAGKGRQTPSQREAEKEWRAAGGVYFVVHSYDRAVTLFHDVIGCINHPEGRFVVQEQMEIA